MKRILFLFIANFHLLTTVCATEYVGIEEPRPSAFVEDEIHNYEDGLLHSLNNGAAFNGILSMSKNNNEVIEANDLKILSVEVKIDVESCLDQG